MEKPGNYAERDLRKSAWRRVKTHPARHNRPLGMEVKVTPFDRTFEFADIPTPNLIRLGRQQRRFGIDRMLALAASFSDLIRAGQHPIHCAHRTVITAFIEQSGVNRGGRGIDETFAIEGLEDLLSFGLTQCERTGRTRFGRPRVASRRTLTINCSAIDSQRHACRGDSRAGLQWVEGVHQMSSPFSCAVGSPSKVQSFFWTSMTMCARASSARKRTISRVYPASRRFCASARSGFGPRRCGVSASRSASRRCLRHLNSSEEYRPSRLISAPLSPEPVQPSAASRMRCLSAAEKRRRFAIGTTSGFGGAALAVPLALRAPGTASEESKRSVMEVFINVVMYGSCLCTLNCPRQVSHLMLTRGADGLDLWRLDA